MTTASGGQTTGEDRLEHRGHERPAVGPWSVLKDEISPYDVTNLPGELQLTMSVNHTGPEHCLLPLDKLENLMTYGTQNTQRTGLNSGKYPGPD